MKSVKFWRIAVKDLSITERIFFRDVIETLLAWQVLKGECPELEIIKRILESELRLKPVKDKNSDSNFWLTHSDLKFCQSELSYNHFKSYNIIR